MRQQKSLDRRIVSCTWSLRIYCSPAALIGGASSIVSLSVAATVANVSAGLHVAELPGHSLGGVRAPLASREGWPCRYSSTATCRSSICCTGHIAELQEAAGATGAISFNATHVHLQSLTGILQQHFYPIA